MKTKQTQRKTIVQTTAATSRGDDRQIQLLEIAGRLFSLRGFNGTSLRDIAEEAKITKAALYYHFPNKEALFHKIVLESLESLVQQVTEASESEPTAEKRVRAFVLTAAENYEQNRESWIASSNAFWTHEESESHAKALAFRDQFEKLLRKYIREGVESGEFREVDPAMAGRVLLSSINGMSRWLKPNGKLSATKVVEQFLDITLGGLRAR